METVSNAVQYVKENLWISVGVLVVVAALSFFVYRKYFAKVSGFADLGAGCDPQIENACGENATCQPDETGTKGVCFPKPEEEQIQEQQQMEQPVEQEQEQEQQPQEE